MSKGCSGVCGGLHGATGPRESPRPLDPKVRLNRPAGGHNSLVTLKRRRKGTGSLRTTRRHPGRVGVPVSEVEAELETLVLLGNLSRSTGSDGQVHYSPGPRRKLLGHMLVDAGFITEAQLQEALAEQNQTGERLGRILVDRGYVSKQTLGQMLEMQRGVPYVNLSTYPIDEKLVRAIPEWVVLQHKVVPLARARRGIDRESTR